MKRAFLRVLTILAALVIGLTAILVVRHQVAVAQVQESWQASSAGVVHGLGTTGSLEILPLVEAAAAREGLQTEPGVSYLIRTDSHTVLMDVGWNQLELEPSPLLHNMRQLGVELEDIDSLAISHMHPDHVGGVNRWLGDTLSLSNEQFDLAGLPVYVPISTSYPGLAPVVSTEPQVIAGAVATTGTIDFIDLFPLSIRRPQASEQALAVNVEGRGIVLIVGCGHPTIQKIVARAEAAFDQPIVGVVGGLHLGARTATDLAPEIEFIKGLNPGLVALSPHDSGTAPIAAFQEAFPGVYQDVKVGRPILFHSN